MGPPSGAGRLPFMSGAEERIEELRRRIAEVAEEFAAAAAAALEASLGGAMKRLVADHAEWFNRFDERTAAALRRTVEETIRKSAMDVGGRLHDEDLWLAPSVVVGGSPAPALDTPANRVWIQLLNGARQLDLVLAEFGLPPSDIPEPGGGHYGLQPQRLSALDPSGRLARLWGRYRQLHEGYARALREPEEERERQAREEARRRWLERH